LVTIVTDPKCRIIHLCAINLISDTN